MEVKYDSRIVVEFSGWDGDMVFELVSGNKWQRSKLQPVFCGILCKTTAHTMARTTDQTIRSCE